MPEVYEHGVVGALRSESQTDPGRILERESLRAEFAEFALTATTAEALYQAALRILVTGLNARAGWVVELEGEGRPRAYLRAELGAPTSTPVGDWLTSTLQVVRDGALVVFDVGDPKAGSLPRALRTAGAGRAMALPLVGSRGFGAAVWLASQSTKVTSLGARLFAESIARSLDTALARLGRERALRRFRESIDLLPDGVLVMRSDGKLLDANDTAVALYGYSREELLALSILDLRAGATLPEVVWQMRQAATSGLVFETVHRRKDGSQFRCDVRSRGALLDGDHVLISVIRILPPEPPAEPH